MYDSLARDYDRFNNWDNRLKVELPFIEREIRKAKPEGQVNVLDAACGTGMHAIALARLGFSSSAADLSPNMIRMARRNSRDARQRVDLRVGGFGELEKVFAPRHFDAVVCLGNSLPHVLTLADLAGTLADFARCLVPGGLLLIQSRNFDAVLDRQERFMNPESYTDREHEWLFQRFYDFESGGLIRFNMVSLKRRHGSDWHAKAVSTLLYPQTRAVILDALSENGFIDMLTYGSMTGDAFDPLTSGNLVVTARKPS